ncbi:hypothetical protein VRB29_08970 [Pseudomonas trivialis]
MLIFIMAGEAQRLRHAAAVCRPPCRPGQNALVEGRVFEIQLLALFQLAAKEAWLPLCIGGGQVVALALERS